MITPAFFLSAVAVRAALFLSTKSIWGDEWMDVFLAHEPVSTAFWGAVRDVHPPLYFVLLRAAVAALGSHEWVFRSISFVSGLGTVFCLYLLGKELLDKRRAIFAASLAAISPYWLQSSNEIRGYALLGFVTVLGSWLFVKALRSPEKALWRWAGLAAAVTAIYVEHYAWFWLAGLGFFLLASFRSRSADLRAWGPVLVVGVLCGLPSLTLIGYQAVYHEHVFEGRRVAELLMPATMIKKIVGIFWHFTSGYVYSMLSWERVHHYLRSAWFFWASLASTAVCFVLMCRGFWESGKNAKTLRALSVLVFFAPLFFLLAVYPVRLDARYLTFAAPFFFLLLACGITAVRDPFIRRFSAALYFAVALYASFITISQTTDPIHKEDYIGLTRYLSQNAKPADVIIHQKREVEYYSKELNLPLRAPHVPDTRPIREQGTAAYQRFFYIFYKNMDPTISQAIYQSVRDEMSGLGLVPESDPVVFGGDEGLLFTYIFRSRAHGA